MGELGQSVVFDVVFSEPVFGFSDASIDLSASTAPGVVAVVTGAGPAYTVTVSGMTGTGTIEINVLANVATDAATNPNAAATIIDNNVSFVNTGVVQFSSSTFTETEQGSPVAVVTVSRVGGSDGVLDIDFATVAGGSATDGLDFTGVSGTLSWAAGDTADKQILVPILDDALFEGDETVNLELSNPSVAGTLGTPDTAVLTITDYEEGVVGFSNAVYNYNEDTGTGSMVVTVTRTSGSNGAVSVPYSVTAGTAVLNSDYSCQLMPTH